MEAIEKLSLLYEGKAKQIWSTHQAQSYWVLFKDEATAFNAKKKGIIPGKGQLNSQFSELFFKVLSAHHIPTHFLQRLDERSLLVKSLTMIPLELIVRNRAAGSLVRRLGVKEGLPIDPPLVEWNLKSDALDDPILSEDHIAFLNLASPSELISMRALALKVNVVLTEFFKAKLINLVDFKLEFGKDAKGQIMVGDEISPDGCRLWEMGSNRILDKDVFRKDLGDLRETYQYLWEKIA